MTYLIGALGRNRTHNLLIRSQALYPVELLAHFVMLTYISIIHFYLQVFFFTIYLMVPRAGIEPARILRSAGF